MVFVVATDGLRLVWIWWLVGLAAVLAKLVRVSRVFAFLVVVSVECLAIR